MADPTPLPRGVIAAALTPMGPELKPDHDAFVAHGRWLLDNGCDGLCVLGTTGEANSLSLDDRLALIDTATAALPPERLIVGTGSCALSDAVRLTRANLSHDVPHVLMLPPFYYKPISDDGVFRFFAALIEAVGDPALRIYLYNFPAMTTHSFGVDVVQRLKAAFGDVIAGMKDSSGDWAHMAEMCGVDDFAVYTGTERYLLDILKIGGAGCITAPANVLAPECQAVYAAWRDGGDAATAQARLTALREAVEAYPGVPALKCLLAHWTGDPRWHHLLPPFAPLADDQVAALARQLDALGHQPARAAAS